MIFNNRYGIEVVGISTDGDSKPFGAMKYLINHPECGIIPVQDATHVATKLRNRILKPGIVLPMGSSHVSVEHLIRLLKDVQKSVHGLSQTDVCPVDRMNFKSFRKITDNRVIESLLQHVENSEATVQFLKLCKQVTFSYLDFELSPSDRIFHIWNGLYFLRIWRHHIKTSTAFRLQDNFISSNAYICIEMNARSLLSLIRKFRDDNKPEHFLPSLFDSQTCERAFRQFRSMGSVEFTRINFSLYDLLHMIGRVEAQNEIAYIRLGNSGIEFPNKREGKSKVFSLPSEEEITATLSKAKEEAINTAHAFGMQGIDIDNFDIDTRLSIEESSDDDMDIIDLAEQNSANDWSEQSDDSELQNAFTKILDENGVERIIRKSTFVWMLTDPSAPISKDRLRRFRTLAQKRKADDSLLQ